MSTDEMRRLENARDMAVRKLMVTGNGANKAENAYAAAWRALRAARIENGEHVLGLRERKR